MKDIYRTLCMYSSFNKINCKISIELWDDAEVVNSFKLQCRLALKQKMSIACFRSDEPDKIIGINLLAVIRQDDVMYKLLPLVRRMSYGFFF